MTDDVVFLDGDYLPRDEAKISVMDRGFLFGDAVYEVIPVYHLHLFRFSQHMQRLQNSLNAIKLNYHVDESHWLSIFIELIDKNKHMGEHLSIYLQISRGVNEIRAHHFSTQVTPTLFAKVAPLNFLSIDELAKGKTAITTIDTRWQNCFIKATSLLANVLLHQMAKDAGSDEAILIDQAKVIEGSSSNVFIVRDDTIVTPPLSPKLLSGITRDLIIELANDNNIPIQQRDIDEAELIRADEIWVASSTRSIHPIIALNGKAVGSGQAGPIWHRMISLYYEYIDSLKNSTTENATAAEEEENKSPLKFPCTFPIKVIGLTDHHIDVIAMSIIRKHVTDINEHVMTSRASKDSKYTAVTITITAESKEQLDAIYLDLSKDKHIIMAL